MKQRQYESPAKMRRFRNLVMSAIVLELFVLLLIEHPLWLVNR